MKIKPKQNNNNNNFYMQRREAQKLLNFEVDWFIMSWSNINIHNFVQNVN